MTAFSPRASKKITYIILDAMQDLGWKTDEKLVKEIRNLILQKVGKTSSLPNRDELTFIISRISKYPTSKYRGNSKGLAELILDGLENSDSVITDAYEHKKEVVNAQRIGIDDIDSFSKAKDISSHEATKVSLEDVYEDDVKEALVKIIGERFTPTHSPSEKSDLYTSQIILNGKRIATAFLLKSMRGPKVMDMKYGLGKRSNQILRLIQEPADLYVVQHTGKITTDVVRHFESQVEKVSRERGRKLYYLVMDGNETARLLLAYGIIRNQESSE